MAEGKTPRHANAAEWEAALGETDAKDAAASAQAAREESSPVSASHLAAHTPAPDSARHAAYAPTTLVDTQLERFYRRTTIGIVGGCLVLVLALCGVASLNGARQVPDPQPSSVTTTPDDTSEMVAADQYTLEQAKESTIIAASCGAHDDPTPEQLAAMDALAPQISVSDEPDTFESSVGFEELLYQVNAWHEAGHEVGFVLRDLTTGAQISYNEEQVFYPASSIKGPYVTCLYQTLVETGQVKESDVHKLAEAAIVNSDNDAYVALHDRFGEPRGEKDFQQWAIDCGATTTGARNPDDFVNYHYPPISASQLAAMWTQMYGYLTSGTDGANTVAGFLSARTTSPIKTAVGDRYQSWGKAGWYYSEDGYNSAPATAEGGVVFAETGPYLVAVLSDAPGDLDGLANVMEGLDAARADLV